jgi:hypothetical protein
MNVSNTNRVRAKTVDQAGQYGDIANIKRPELENQVLSTNLAPEAAAASLGAAAPKAPTCAEHAAERIGPALTWDSPAFTHYSVFILQELLKQFKDKYAASESESHKAVFFESFKLLHNEIELRLRFQQHRGDEPRPAAPKAKRIADQDDNPVPPEFATTVGLIWGYLKAFMYKPAYTLASAGTLIWPGNKQILLLGAYAAIESRQAVSSEMANALQELESPEWMPVIVRRAPNSPFRTRPFHAERPDSQSEQDSAEDCKAGRTGCRCRFGGDCLYADSATANLAARCADCSEPVRCRTDGCRLDVHVRTDRVLDLPGGAADHNPVPSRAGGRNHPPDPA